MNSIPTMTRWITDPAEGGDYLLSLFLTTDAKQSNLYLGETASLQYLIATEHTTDIGLASATETALLKMYNRYLSDVDVDVTVTTTDAVSDIKIDINFTDDGINYHVGNTAVIKDSTLEKVLGASNGT